VYLRDTDLLGFLNTAIRVDAKRYGISNIQLIELAKLYFEANGKHPPENLGDLLGVLC